MRVLITGATGFIGSRLALRRAAAGDQVIALGRDRSAVEQANARELRAAGIAVHDASVTDPVALEPLFAGVDQVFHLAAAQHEAGAPDEHFRAINVTGTRNVMDAAVAASVKRVVHGSTIGVYETRVGQVVDERAPLIPQNIYGVTKLAGEEVVRGYAGRVSFAIARISETYGPGDRRLLKLFRAARRGIDLRIGSGANLHHLVFIDDLLDGLETLARSESADGRTFVLAGPDAVSTRALLDAVSQALGCHPWRIRVPLQPLLALAALVEHACRPLGLAPPLHRRRMDFFVKSYAFAQDEVRRQIGHVPRIDLHTGMQRTAAWYREKALL